MSTPPATLFVDRDGTLVEEPPDEQIDALDTLPLRKVPVIAPALLMLKAWVVVDPGGSKILIFPPAARTKPCSMVLLSS